MLSIKKYITDPAVLGHSLLIHFGRFLPDKIYIKWQYQLRMRKRLNLKHPQTFTEKLQWLKLYNRKPEYTTMVDKYEVKEYVTRLIGEKYIIPTLGLWEKPEDIDWDELPNQFVLKTTHGGGNCGVVVCTNKGELNKDDVCRQLKISLKQDLYRSLREWPYKNVKKRILAEKYMVDESGYELKDYKVFCFDGEPKMIDVDYNRKSNHQRNLYTPSWERINATLGYPSGESIEIERPIVLEELLRLSRSLSIGIPHVRTDFYIIGNKIYFGELTFFHGSGFEKAYPKSFDKKMGDWLVLPEKQK